MIRWLGGLILDFLNFLGVEEDDIIPALAALYIICWLLVGLGV